MWLYKEPNPALCRTIELEVGSDAVHWPWSQDFLDKSLLEGGQHRQKSPILHLSFLSEEAGTYRGPRSLLWYSPTCDELIARIALISVTECPR